MEEPQNNSTVRMYHRAQVAMESAQEAFERMKKAVEEDWRTGTNDDNARMRRDSLDAAHDAYERMQAMQKTRNENMSPELQEVLQWHPSADKEATKGCSKVDKLETAENFMKEQEISDAFEGTKEADETYFAEIERARQEMNHSAHGALERAAESVRAAKDASEKVNALNNAKADIQAAAEKFNEAAQAAAVEAEYIHERRKSVIEKAEEAVLHTAEAIAEGAKNLAHELVDSEPGKAALHAVQSAGEASKNLAHGLADSEPGKAAIHAVQSAGEASKNLAHGLVESEPSKAAIHAVQSAGEAFANATKGTPIN